MPLLSVALPFTSPQGCRATGCVVAHLLGLQDWIEAPRHALAQSQAYAGHSQPLRSPRP